MSDQVGSPSTRSSPGLNLTLKCPSGSPTKLISQLNGIHEGSCTLTSVPRWKFKRGSGRAPPETTRDDGCSRFWNESSGHDDWDGLLAQLPAVGSFRA